MNKLYKVIDLQAAFKHLEETQPIGCANAIEQYVGIQAGEHYIYWNDYDAVLVHIKPDIWGSGLRGFLPGDTSCAGSKLYYMHNYKYAMRVK